MKETFFVLKNNSRSTGTYIINGEEKELFPRESVTLTQKPTSYTENITFSMYRSEVPDTKNLNKKNQTTKSDSNIEGE